jgi:hypothetical protein
MKKEFQQEFAFMLGLGWFGPFHLGTCMTAFAAGFTAKAVMQR